MRYVSAGALFVLVFALSFVLGGWFLMPHLPPVPDHPVTVFESEYWTDNWAGAILGIVLGALAVWHTLRRHQR